MSNNPDQIAAAPPDEIIEICKELGCTTKPGVALRFVKELRRDLQLGYERQIELLRSWDEATPTERQELDRLRRGWGPSTPTERMARRTDLRGALTAIERAMNDVMPDDKVPEDLTLDHFQQAYDRLLKQYQAIIALLHALPRLDDPDLPGPALHRHLKTGHLVEEVARGKAQVSARAIEEMSPVAIYRHKGKWWVRYVDEFDDGRFEPVAAPAETA